MSVQEDKMRIALNGLVKTHQMVLSAITELRRQDYTTEADNLVLVLTDLETRTKEAIEAVNLP